MDLKGSKIYVLEVWVKLDYFHTKAKSIQQLFRTLTNGNVGLTVYPIMFFTKTM